MIQLFALLIIALLTSGCSAVGDLFAGGGSDISNPSTQLSEGSSSDNISDQSSFDNLSGNITDESSGSKTVDLESSTEADEDYSDSSEDSDDSSEEHVTEISSQESHSSNHNDDSESIISSVERSEDQTPSISSEESDEASSSFLTEAPTDSSDKESGDGSNTIILGEVSSPSLAPQANSEIISDTINVGNSTGILLSGADTLTFELLVDKSQTYVLSLRVMGEPNDSPYILEVPLASTESTFETETTFQIPANGKWSTIEELLYLDAGEYTLKFISPEESNFTINYLLFELAP
ncbi:MAG: hypothetical protein OCC49_05230 [Fibrobacterales bacterium]